MDFVDVAEAVNTSPNPVISDTVGSTRYSLCHAGGVSNRLPCRLFVHCGASDP